MVAHVQLVASKDILALAESIQRLDPTQVPAALTLAYPPILRGIRSICPLITKRLEEIQAFALLMMPLDKPLRVQAMVYDDLVEAACSLNGSLPMLSVLRVRMREHKKDSLYVDADAREHGSGRGGGTSAKASGDKPHSSGGKGGHSVPTTSSKSTLPHEDRRNLLHYLTRNFGSTTLPNGTCYSCHYLKRAKAADGHSMKDCPHLEEAWKRARPSAVGTSPAP